MKTREKILHQAREMFNARGIAAVSSRNISEEMGISYGNLCYHFPRKDDIILQLYRDMQTELDLEVANLKAEIFRFDFMVRSLRKMLEVHYRYKFIFLDLSSLSRKFPFIQEHARRQYQFRVAICREIYDFLMQEGYLKMEKKEGHYDKLVHSVLMILNAWIVDSEIYYEGSENKKVDHYLEMIYRFVSSSLTKEGAEAFMKVYLDPPWGEKNEESNLPKPRPQEP
ncbi:MAG: TetR/AcrR family transcriptional regulator [Bacteroidota bacterium]